jgi:ABC-2 type transport system permease protein/lipopolysaccharide transport system permease protein
VPDLPQLSREPPRELRAITRVHLITALTELFHRRDLIRALVERELRSRYKQAVLGFGWTLGQPLSLALVFSVVIPRLGHVDTGKAPYVLFSFVGVLTWGFFSESVSLGGLSIVNNTAQLNKVYCPRAVFPLAMVVVAAIDALVSTLALVALFVVYGFVPHLESLWVPVLFTVQVVFTVAITVAISAVVVYLRDIRHGLPIILQLGLFVTPVAYGLDKVPSSVRALYSFANPLGPVIDGYRRTVLNGQPPQWTYLGLGALSSLLLVTGSLYLFKRLERGFADLV